MEEHSHADAVPVESVEREGELRAAEKALERLQRVEAGISAVFLFLISVIAGVLWFLARFPAAR